MADITTGLGLHCPFIANGNDISGNGRNMTAVGTPVHGAGGKFGNCLLGVNATNYYRIATPTWLNGLTAYSITGWFRRATYSNTAVGYCTNGTTVTAGYPFDGNNGNGARYFVGAASVFDRNDGVPAANDWAFMAFVMENTSSCKLYINNLSPSTSSSNATLPASVTDIRVGNFNATQPFDGDICDFRVYTRGLTADDVLMLYHLPRKTARVNHHNRLRSIA